MSSIREMDHLERTANNYRQNVRCCQIHRVVIHLLSVCLAQYNVFCVYLITPQALYPARICGIMNESETVKRLRISVHPDFCFKAGQW